MYEVRTTYAGVLVRERFEDLQAVSDYLRSLGEDQKIVGVYELDLSNQDRPTSKQMSCVVEGDLVVLGKPM